MIEFDTSTELDDAELLWRAKDVAKTSPNLSRKTGAALSCDDGDGMFAVFLAPNTFPPRIANKPERLEGEARYAWLEHAERNVLHYAASCGIRTSGAKLVTPWFPCVDCARAIVGHGVRTLVCSEPDFDDPRWGPGFRIADEMLREAGVEIVKIDPDSV